MTDVSYHIAQYTSIIDELKDEVHRLRKKLEEAKNLNKQGVSIHAVQCKWICSKANIQQIMVGQ